MMTRKQVFDRLDEYKAARACVDFSGGNDSGGADRTGKCHLQLVRPMPMEASIFLCVPSKPISGEPTRVKNMRQRLNV